MSFPLVFFLALRSVSDLADSTCVVIRRQQGGQKPMRSARGRRTVHVVHVKRLRC